jgi:hypothetical protein
MGCGTPPSVLPGRDDGGVRGYSRTTVPEDDGDGDAITVLDGVGVGVGEDVTTTAGLMTRLSVAVADVPAVAVRATEKVPDAVGVPVIAPAELIESPAGRPVAVHVAVPVPPVAATVAL